MILGCIGDDFTGSSDLANTLAKNGVSVTQYNGIPKDYADDSVEVGIVALKSRNIDSDKAIDLSLNALEWLLKQGCQQIYFKYCSTFDSTKKGNIGPVSQALADRLNASCVIFCPSFPETGRRVFSGHLFVNNDLLNESGMENHPITPMTDSNIIRWLAKQTTEDVGHVDINIVKQGADEITKQLDSKQALAQRFIVIDAIDESDLREIAKAVVEYPLITGGSGLALGLPGAYREKQLIGNSTSSWQGTSGKTVVFSGSCSRMTMKQIDYHCSKYDYFALDIDKILNDKSYVQEVSNWVNDHDNIPLVYSSANAQEVKDYQIKYGLERVASSIENFFGDLAIALEKNGINKIICAGGETSGAVIEALNVPFFDIGPEIAAGVPALKSNEQFFALKSGNFGQVDFFELAEKKLSE